jgi:hypothetical protein
MKLIIFKTCNNGVCYTGYNYFPINSVQHGEKQAKPKLLWLNNTLSIDTAEWKYSAARKENNKFM